MLLRELLDHRAAGFAPRARGRERLRVLERQLVVGETLGEERAVRLDRFVEASDAREIARIAKLLPVGAMRAKQRRHARDRRIAGTRRAKLLQRRLRVAVLVGRELDAREKLQRLRAVGRQAKHFRELLAREVVARAVAPELRALQQPLDLGIGREGGERPCAAGEERGGRDTRAHQPRRLFRHATNRPRIT